MGRKAILYLVDRAKEPSTWRGLVLIATASGAVISTDDQEIIITAGLFLAGLLGAIMPDEKSRP